MVVGGVPETHYVIVGYWFDFKKGVRIKYLFLLRLVPAKPCWGLFVCFCRRIIVKRITCAYQVQKLVQNNGWWCIFSLAIYRILIELRISKYVIFLGDAKMAQKQTNLATRWKMFLCRHLFDSEKYKLLLWASIGPLRLRKIKFKRKMIHLNLTREGGSFVIL